MISRQGFISERREAFPPPGEDAKLMAEKILDYCRTGSRINDLQYAEYLLTAYVRKKQEETAYRAFDQIKVADRDYAIIRTRQVSQKEFIDAVLNNPQASKDI